MCIHLLGKVLDILESKQNNLSKNKKHKKGSRVSLNELPPVVNQATLVFMKDLPFRLIKTYFKPDFLPILFQNMNLKPNMSLLR